jgi:hypothetical protein
MTVGRCTYPSAPVVCRSSTLAHVLSFSLYKCRPEIAREKIRDVNSLCESVLCLIELLWACEALGLWSSFSL